MASHPIWFNASTDAYTTTKSFGAKDYAEIEILVGRSSKNNTKLGVLTVGRQKDYETDTYDFVLSLNGEVITRIAEDTI